MAAFPRPLRDRKAPLVAIRRATVTASSAPAWHTRCASGRHSEPTRRPGCVSRQGRDGGLGPQGRGARHQPDHQGGHGRPGATCPACRRGWQHVVFGIGEQSGDFATASAELIGDVAPSLSGGLTIRPDYDLPNCGRDYRLLTSRDAGQQRSHEMDDAGLDHP